MSELTCPELTCPELTFRSSHVHTHVGAAMCIHMSELTCRSSYVHAHVCTHVHAYLYKHVYTYDTYVHRWLDTRLCVDM